MYMYIPIYIYICIYIVCAFLVCFDEGIYEDPPARSQSFFQAGKLLVCSQLCMHELRYAQIEEISRSPVQVCNIYIYVCIYIYITYLYPCLYLILLYTYSYFLFLRSRGVLQTCFREVGLPSFRLGSE